MASKKDEAARLQVLGEFIKAYEALRNCRKAMAELIDLKFSDDTPMNDEIVKYLELHSILNTVGPQLKRFHHKLGHAVFDDVCWDATHVGQEFMSPIEQLKAAADEAGFDLGIRILDPDNLPDDLPDELMKQIKRYIASQEN